ncbi:MAG TPA: agmatinase [Clostridia bacterium]|nr:agmatinase [Clostridia bacterium]
MNNYPRISFNECGFEEANIVVFGAPFDGTTSFRPGTRFGPQAIRNDFYGIESYSPLLNKDLEDFKLYDAGDLVLPFGNTKNALNMIKEQVSDILNKGKFPFLLGGEHLVSLPAIESIYAKYENLRIIHLDAHTDLRDDYLGEKYSHSTVMRRVWDLVGDEKIYQFGIRSGTKEEFSWSELGHTYINKYDLYGIDTVIEQIKKYPIYITIDLDVLDPSLFPGTGTPEAGGISYKELEKLFTSISQLNVVGADIVELSPHFDASGVSTAVACKVIREMILSI